ncbi:hypothetical protein MSG28_001449 [Choristoneura fumiferana]|uniref:Uncharacterized protein n=1 Tax=Choristoneura fumiferana TaxID=7141 RepID=A0ACC0KU44_CHOFU|nr:hypothetical protein MSG28_001449 [Choristoneura fumiferana]
MKALIVLSIVFVVNVYGADQRIDPLVLINQGLVRGQKATDGDYSTFLGIPYAKVDLDDPFGMHGNEFFDKDFFYSWIQNTFVMENEEVYTAAKIVRHFYVGDKDISSDVNTEAEYFNSDIVFNHPIQDTITRLINENASHVYEYVFSYVGDTGLSGAAHSAELPFLFDLYGDFGELMTHSSTEDDLLMVDRLTTLWTNFIKYGNPTPETSELIPVTWSPVTANSRPYLIINKELRMETEERFLKERMAFWDLFYSIYGQYNIFA